MRQFILAVVILSSSFILNGLYGVGGGENEPEGDEISMVVLDELFDKASIQWKMAAESIWSDYSKGQITVKTTSGVPASYDLHSNTLGDLIIKTESFDLNRVSSESAVQKMRESLLLDTEEKTDNEGGSEDL